jgi:hypothetical protein
MWCHEISGAMELFADVAAKNSHGATVPGALNFKQTSNPRFQILVYQLNKKLTTNLTKVT